MGGRPSRFGLAVAEFHRLNVERQARWPAALSATATHDTKRGEDVRARINVLSEIPREWRAGSWRWRRINRAQEGRRSTASRCRTPTRSTCSTRPWWAPGPSEPLSAEVARRAFAKRLQQYMFKAVREAKVHASWINPAPELRRAVAALRGRHPRSASLAGLPERLPALPARRRALRHVHVAGPDADQAHRARRARLLPGHRALGLEPGGSGQSPAGGLRACAAGLLEELDARDRRGAPTWRRWPGGWWRPRRTAASSSSSSARPWRSAAGPRALLFATGEYRPLEARVPRAEHVCAFARVGSGASAMTRRAAPAGRRAASRSRPGAGGVGRRRRWPSSARRGTALPATCSPARRVEAEGGRARRGGRASPAFRSRCCGGDRVTATTRERREPFVVHRVRRAAPGARRQALDERELMDRLEEVPAGSIFFHVSATSSATARHHRLRQRLRAVGGRRGGRSGPRRAARRRRSLRVRRARGAARGAGHDRPRPSARAEAVPRVEFERAFHFQQSHIVEVPLGPPPRTLAEFRAGLGARGRRARSTPHGRGAGAARAALGRLRRVAPRRRSTCRRWPSEFERIDPYMTTPRARPRPACSASSTSAGGEEARR